MDEKVAESDTSDVCVDMRILDCSDNEESDFLFEVPTKNRFEVQRSGRGSEWKTVRSTKRKKVSSTGSVDTSNFDELSDSNKLTRLFETVTNNKDLLLHITEEQSRYHIITNDLRQQVEILSERADRTERRLDQHANYMTMLAYRSIDTEARSRRNNVIIWGVTERSPKNIENLVLGFLEDELDMDTSFIVIDRAHRMGSNMNRNRSQTDPKRPIIVRFRDYSDTEAVMRRSYKLKGTPFGMDRDYPMEIAVARKKLYKSTAAQEARANRKKIQIKYPAKLFVEGRLVDDSFPDWHHFLKSDRIAFLEKEHREGDNNNQGNDQGEYDNDTEIDSSVSSTDSESESCVVPPKKCASEKCKQSYCVHVNSECNNPSSSKITPRDRSSSHSRSNKVTENQPAKQQRPTSGDTPTNAKTQVQ